MRVEVRPEFDKAVMTAELPVRKAVAKVFHQLRALNLVQLWQYPGLNFEKLHGMIEPISGQQLYSIRVTGSARAVTCLIDGPTIVLISLHTQHDNAYRR
jgi:hypothetical protein